MLGLSRANKQILSFGESPVSRPYSAHIG